MSSIELDNAKMKVAEVEHKVLVTQGYLLGLETFELSHRRTMPDELHAELRKSIKGAKEVYEKHKAEWRQRVQELSEIDLFEGMSSY